MHGDECCAAECKCDGNTQEVLLIQSHIDPGMLRFRSWEWRIIPDKKNKMDLTKMR